VRRCGGRRPGRTAGGATGVWVQAQARRTYGVGDDAKAAMQAWRSAPGGLFAVAVR
jgi:hypothetical protein